ncbi:MAG: hypothetical protein ABIA63_13980, partial [bacterium]
MLGFFLFSIPFWSFYLCVGIEGTAFKINALLSIAIFSGYIAYAVIKREYLYIAITFVILNVFQNFVYGLSFNLNMERNTELIFFLGIKDVFIGLSFLILMILDRKLIARFTTNVKIHDIPLIIWFIFIGVHFIISGAPLMAKVSYLRNFTFCFLLFYIGQIIIIHNKDAVPTFLKFVILLGIAACIFEFFEMLFFDRYLYGEVFNIPKLYQAKYKFDTVPDLPGGRDYRFYTDIAGMAIKRCGSFLFEPVSLSYFLAFVWVVLLFINDKRNLWIWILITVGLAFSFGKGGFIAAFISLTGFLFFRKKPEKKIYHLLLIILPYVVVLLFFSKQLSHSAVAHVVALTYAFYNLGSNILGQGMGVGGNFGTMF